MKSSRIGKHLYVTNFKKNEIKKLIKIKKLSHIKTIFSNIFLQKLVIVKFIKNY